MQTWNDDETGQCPAGTAIRTGKTDVIQNWSDTARNGPWKNSGSKNGIRSSLAIPLINDGKAIGALMLYANVANGFTHEKICLLEEITRDLTYKLVNMRSQEEGRKDSGDAKKQQRSILEADRLYSRPHRSDGLGRQYRACQFLCS